jgi:putative NADPH-quinone reductase
MRLLVVFCHPDPESFCAAILRTASAALQAAGHELRLIDLYAEGFDPAMSLAERRSYLVDTAQNIAGVASHVEALRWAEGWIAIYPTWYYGPPAMLKGWLERVWLPGVSFQVATAKKRTIRGELRQIRRFVGITTSGSPWWWLRVIGDPGRSLLMKGLRPLYARGCRMGWLQLHDMNHATAADRVAFLAKVDHTMRKLT